MSMENNWILTGLASWKRCWCSVAHSCLTLHKDYSMPSFPVLHHLPEACSNSCPLNQWCHPTISSSVVPFSSHLQSFPASGSVSMSWLLVSGGQGFGASASALVLPKNIQDWFPLALSGLISMQSKFWATQSMVLGKNSNFEDPQSGPWIHRSLITKISDVKLQLPWTRWSQRCLLISGSQTILLPMK